MAGTVRFKVHVKTQGADALPEVQGRLQDLSPALSAIVDTWAKKNPEKFERSIGMESSGADVDELVHWDPLVPGTSAAKRREGMPDWIMVATGDLMHALSSPDLIFRDVRPDSVLFGTPLNLEEALKVQYNWIKRQAIFISTLDQNFIRRIIKDYLDMGGDFEQKRFAAGLAAVRTRSEMDAMDAQYDATVGDAGDGF